MKISVVIPCHNAGPWIQEALRSVAEQTYQPHEIIVVDDGSTDDSVEKIRSSGVDVQLLERSFRNAAKARNVGIERASGDLIAFLDADNRWLPHHLAQATGLLRRASDGAYMCWSSDSPPSQSKDKKDAELHPPDVPAVGLTAEHFVQWRLSAGYGFPTTGMVARAGVLHSERGFDQTQVRRHDFELFMRIAASVTWCFHPKPSWYSRPPRLGDISANQPECCFYALRAYVLNAERYASSPAMRPLIRKQARSAMNSALEARDPEQINRVWTLARGCLDKRNRLMFGLARYAPSIASWTRAATRLFVQTSRGSRKRKDDLIQV